MGSIPITRFTARRFAWSNGDVDAAVAQSVEHVLGKDEVTGSNPVSSSILGAVVSLAAGLLLRATVLSHEGFETAGVFPALPVSFGHPTRTGFDSTGK